MHYCGSQHHAPVFCRYYPAGRGSHTFTYTYIHSHTHKHTHVYMHYRCYKVHSLFFISFSGLLPQLPGGSRYTYVYIHINSHTHTNTHTYICTIAALKRMRQTFDAITWRVVVYIRVYTDIYIYAPTHTDV